MASLTLQDSLDNLFYVYGQLDSTGVLDVLFPNRDCFYESNVQELNYSFLKYLDANPDLEDSQKTSIQQTFRNKGYTTIFSLFHDIRIACTVQLLLNEDNETEYTKIDKFYKISTELLLREAVRLGVSLGMNETKKTEEGAANGQDLDTEKETASPVVERVTRMTRNQANHVDENEPVKDEGLSKAIITTDRLLTSLEEDFDLITSTFYNNTGKSLSIFASGNIPFFSSLNNLKSDLDDREPVIDPALGVTVTNVIPNISMENKDTLAKLTDTNIKIPNLRQILENYMHPNWLRLISSPWLKHGSGINSLNFSFAPTHDETQSIISNDWKGLTWCQQIGFKRLVETKTKEVEQEKKESKETQEIEATGDSKKEDVVVDDAEKMDVDDNKTNDEGTKKEPNGETAEETKTIDNLEEFDLKSIGQVDMKNILNYDENKLVSASEVEIVETNKVQSTISKLLIDLSQLRQERIIKQRDNARYNKDNLGTGGRIFKPSTEEVKLYHKIRRLITGLIDNKNVKPTDLELPLDTRIPVLQHTYQGTLPAPLTTNQKVTKSKRRR